MTVYLLYCDTDGNYIDELCAKNLNLTTATYFVPCIGETFIDRKRKIEYEVKDVVRILDMEEYGIQVLLKKREQRKYK